jgi:hypothetical protein
MRAKTLSAADAGAKQKILAALSVKADPQLRRYMDRPVEKGYPPRSAPVAQGIEYWPPKPRVARSIRARRAIPSCKVRPLVTELPSGGYGLTRWLAAAVVLS